MFAKVRLKTTPVHVSSLPSSKPAEVRSFYPGADKARGPARDQSSELQTSWQNQYQSTNVSMKFDGRGKLSLKLGQLLLADIRVTPQF